MESQVHFEKKDDFEIIPTTIPQKANSSHKSCGFAHILEIFRNLSQDRRLLVQRALSSRPTNIVIIPISLVYTIIKHGSQYNPYLVTLI